MITADSHRKRPVLLCILDGWGDRPDRQDNAIAQARTPNLDKMMVEGVHADLLTSGLAVGLPDGQMGNSEVGHMNLGAGRVVMQDLPRIDAAAKDGSLAKNPALLRLIDTLKKSGGTAHLLGLLSPGGVHSHMDQMAALARIIADAGVPVAVHPLLDGRDTPPSSGAGYMDQFLAATKGKNIRIATVGGRYYTMDRDKRWERVVLGYDAMVSGKGIAASDAPAAIKASYANGKTDEFMLPAIVGGYQGMKDGDGLVMANFRADRARQILTALLDPSFNGFARSKIVKFSAQVGMVEYSTELNKFLELMFPPENLDRVMGEVVSEAKLHQLRIAETEKYAHVTFFFNGGREDVFPGEDRIIVPSPKVATYDLQPEMSAPEVTDKLVAAIESGKYDFIVLNFANGDMVGHTGMLEPAIKAVECVDTCLGRIRAALKKQGGAMLITADHGNAEMMRDPTTGEPHTAHTTGPVPLILVDAPASVTGIADGRLADVSPTLLALLGLPQPKEMTGKSLLIQETQSQAQRRAAH